MYVINAQIDFYYAVSFKFMLNAAKRILADFHSRRIKWFYIYKALNL